MLVQEKMEACIDRYLWSARTSARMISMPAPRKGKKSSADAANAGMRPHASRQIFHLDWRLSGTDDSGLAANSCRVRYFGGFNSNMCPSSVICVAANTTFSRCGRPRFLDPFTKSLGIMVLRTTWLGSTSLTVTCASSNVGSLATKQFNQARGLWFKSRTKVSDFVLAVTADTHLPGLKSSTPGDGAFPGFSTSTELQASLLVMSRQIRTRNGI